MLQTLIKWNLIQEFGPSIQHLTALRKEETQATSSSTQANIRGANGSGSIGNDDKTMTFSQYLL